MEGPELDPHKITQLIFVNKAKAIEWRKYCYSTNGAGDSHAKKINT